jgi:hypothetical protein
VGRGGAARRSCTKWAWCWGEDALIGALKLYVAQNAGRIATAADFYAALSQASGRDATGLMTELLTDIDQYVGQALDWYE